MIGGGKSNVANVTSGDGYATIAGGLSNSALNPYSSIGGGWANTIDAVGYYNTVGGGRVNKILELASRTTIAGGSNNIANAA